MKMFRIKKKFLLAIFIIVFFVYLYFYLYSNVPTNSDKFVSDVQKPIPNSYKKPRTHIHDVIHKQIDDDNDNLLGEEDPEQSNLGKKDLINDQILPENSNNDAEMSCNLDVDSLPDADVNMLEAYNEIPFDNVDGGVWKQGEISVRAD
jgi:cell shape-determining protein MreC